MFIQKYVIVYHLFHILIGKNITLYCWSIIQKNTLVKNLELELHTLCRTLLARKYPLKIILPNITKALRQTRENLLEYKEQETSSEVTPLITEYTPTGTLVNKAVHNNWHLIENDDTLRRIWPNNTVTAYKRAENLKDLLVHSKQVDIWLCNTIVLNITLNICPPYTCFINDIVTIFLQAQLGCMPGLYPTILPRGMQFFSVTHKRRPVIRGS